MQDAHLSTLPEELGTALQNTIAPNTPARYGSPRRAHGSAASALYPQCPVPSIV